MVPCVGGLTDIFTIISAFEFQDDINKFYLCESAIEEEPYLLSMLILLYGLPKKDLLVLFDPCNHTDN
jgi:hypothetical protein